MKDRLTRWIAVMGYYCGLDRLFYWINRRCKRVLTFHNVFPDELCRKDDGGGMSLSASDFRRVIGEIGRIYRFSNDLNDPKTATITFDDGFLNQYEVAAHILEELKLSAVLFIAGKNINRTNPMDAPAVDLLTVWLAEVPKKILGDESRIRYWVDELRPAYVRDAANYGRTVVEACNARYSFEKVFEKLGRGYTRLRLGGISSAQLEDLRRRGWRIGWHSYNHFALSAIPPTDKMREFDAPDEIKREPMSYPYGEPKSVSDEDVHGAEAAGFPAAYSNLPEVNPMLGRYFLPRFSVPTDKVMLHFHLSGFRHFLKYRALLPDVYGGNGAQ